MLPCGASSSQETVTVWSIVTPWGTVTLWGTITWGNCHCTRHQHPSGHRYTLQHHHPARQESLPTGHCPHVPAPVLSASSLLLPRALPAQGHDGSLWLCLLGDKNPFCFFCLPGDMGISWLFRDQLTLPCLGTGSLSTFMGTSSFVPDKGLATQGECTPLPAWGHGHFHQLGDNSPLLTASLLRDISILWLPGDRNPFCLFCLLGDMGISWLLGARSFLPAKGRAQFLATQEEDPLCLLGDMAISTAWGQECSLLTASVLGNMAILWIPGDQITFPCVGTRSLRTYLGTRTFLLVRGQERLLGDRVLLCVLGHTRIFWLLGDRVLNLPAQEQRHFSLPGDRSPLYLGHLLPPWEKDHIRLLGDKTPDYISGDKITACLGTWASPGFLRTGAWQSSSCVTQLDGCPLHWAPLMP